MKTDSIKLLILEDDADDARMMVRELEKRGLTVSSRVVSSARELNESLESFKPDVILSDYTLPGFGGIQALDISLEKAPGTPFIFVSGTLGEELAIDMLKRGATDFVLKSYLARLAPAVRRALEEKEKRAEYERASRQIIQELRESDLRYRALFDGALNLIYLNDLEGRFLDANDAALKLLGYTREELSTLTYQDLLSGPDLEKAYMQLSSIMMEGRETRFEEYLLRKKTGDYVFVESSASLLTKNGEPYAVLGMARDVTEKKKLVDEVLGNYTAQHVLNRLLHISLENLPLDTLLEKFLDELLNQTRVKLKKQGAIFIYDAQSDTLHLRAQHGMPAEVANRCRRLVKGVCLCGRAVLEGRIIFSDGTGDDHEISFNGMQEHGHYCIPVMIEGAPAGVIALYLEAGHRRTIEEETFFDAAADILAGILQRRRSEESLIISEAKFRTLFNGMNDAIFIHETDGKFIEVNETACSVLGYSKDELLMLKPSLIDAPDSAAKIPDRMAELLRKGTILFESVHVAKNGKYIPVEINSRIIEYDGRPAIMSIARDITERISAIEKVKKAHTEVLQLLNAITSIIIGVSLKDTVSHWNPAAETVFGIKKSVAVGARFSELKLGWEWAKIFEGISTCITEDRPVRLEDIHLAFGDGNIHVLGVTVNPIKDADSILTGFIIRGADITDRRLMEQQLAQAQKMESIGQLAAGIAHEINTPMQFVGDNLYFLRNAFKNMLDLVRSCVGIQRTLSEDPDYKPRDVDIEEAIRKTDLEYLSAEIPNAIQESIDGVDRVVGIIKSMKEFSHPGGASKTLTDVNSAIRSTMTISRNVWKYTSDIVLDLDPDLPLIPLLTGEFNQAILNIIVNASQAIEDAVREHPGVKGTISVSTKYTGKRIDIRISDTGMGIPENIRKKIFDPFFTTKEVGKGTGQGLAIAYNVIVLKHGGTIDFTSETGQGSEFIITLPLEQP